VSRVCEVWRLGEVDYTAALALQTRLAAARGRGETGDRLLLLTHPHTFTLGSAGRMEHLLWNEAECQRRGVRVCRADRGGDITYHGPGQLVAYPIVALERRDAVGYVRALEQVVIGALADCGIAAQTLAGLTGVWAGGAKICAIGVRVTARAVTRHGFALNVNPDLAYFGGIIPCGLRDRAVTSMAALLGRPPDWDTVEARIAARFGQVFGFEMVV
jgi:lipoyl(octanoyl) transferase